MPLRYGEQEPSIPPMAMPTSWPRPRISEYGPREVRMHKQVRLLTYGFSGLAVVSLFVGIGVTLNRQALFHALAKDGVQTTAVVVSLDEADEDPYAVVRFRADNRPAQARIEVDRKLFETFVRGQQIPIRYLPSDPAFARLAPYTAANAAKDVRGIVVIAGIVTLSIGLAPVILCLVGRREAQILSSWPATTAQIVAKNPIGSTKGTNFKVTYRFRPMRGEVFERTASVQLRQPTEIVVGGFADVLYDPERPQKSTLRNAISVMEVAVD